MTTHAETRAPDGATLVDCTHERHADQILAIFNDAIVNSTALYDYKPRPREAMAAGSRPNSRAVFRCLGTRMPTAN
jgi:phosphinothricin acetyltransferase